MREIVLDTETTGLSPQQGHKIVEIGCVEIINRIPTGKTFHVYINPQRDMPTEAQNVHGLSIDFLKDKPIFSSIANDFLEFISDAPLVIHNASFDLNFLDFQLQELKLRKASENEIIDTLLLARRKHPGQSNSLDALCNRYNIDLKKRDKHGALLDSFLLAEVYIELLGERQAGLNLNSDQVNSQDILISNSNILKTRPKSLKSPFSSEDEALHLKFIDEIGEKSLWRNFQ